jgi:hypothetical protein
MARVAETFKIVIDGMTNCTDFNLVSVLYAENTNLAHEDMNASVGELQNQWDIQRVSHNTLISSVKPSSNDQLPYFAGSFGMFDDSHLYKTTNSVGWQIAKTGKIGFQLQLTATPGFHSLDVRCFQMIWLFSGALDNPEDDTVMEKHGAEALYLTAKSLMHAIRI